ncbi:SusC/RagA family TonB-linked outer membrane protein [Desertivirga brevis]|uniref:SusC/RagA family TonB-linked outer membrane protein n=1 Tax=Desertivirga brevis TaxID=2810310 RepID=UPI001A96F83C|nr:SusC/RagA family TonB-linked outer membrane protein [Pedobacter sp. SYSU D00873]
MRYLLLAFSVFAVAGISRASGVENEKKIRTPETRNVFSVKKIAFRDSVHAYKKAHASRSSSKDSMSAKLPAITPFNLSLFPAVTLPQFVKGRFAGLNVQESSGEPGTNQTMFIRGSALPLLSPRHVYDAQPLVILDGMPLVTEHPFAYDIQQYNFNRIGPATNVLSNIDMDNIASVEVLSDVEATAVYGPQAANGIILLKSKLADTIRRVTFSSYIGYSPRPGVTTINGNYENAFRQRFYDLYTATGRNSEDEVYPVYLSDSLSAGYFGPSNWSDLYYRNAMSYSINASITGGTRRANFRFSLGNLQNQGVADETAVNRYSTRFNINMRPVKWLLFSAMVNANRVERDRNRSLRDRFTQVNYFPDLSSPLSPNKEVYGDYLSLYDKGFDDNKINIIDGYANLGLDLGAIRFDSRLAVNYNEGYRDIFYSRSLMQNTSYASNYYGFNQRFLLTNSAKYDKAFDSGDNLHLELGQSIQWDTYKYNNAYAYKGSSDFIKINLLFSDPNKPNEYLLPRAFPKELVFRFLDRTRSNLLSAYTTGDYSIKNKYSFSTTLRVDGSSNAQPTKRWFFSPTASVAWNLKNELFSQSKGISALDLKFGIGRIGRLNSYDNYAAGPQYMSNVGYTGNVTVPGYNAFAVLTRPYNFGWVGYGVPWAYSDQVNGTVSTAILNNRFRFAATLYSKTEKDLLFGVPDGAEYGYREFIKSGMSVSNKGIDVIVAGDIIRSPKNSWSSSLSFNVNRNRLKALPGGVEQVEIGNRLLKVGEALDSYWLLQNDGIYESDADVPVRDGEVMKFNGSALKGGDPRWRDINGDNAIDNSDKVMMGHALPILYGSFDNALAFGKWNLNLNFYYNLGRDIINQNMANRFDFINREGQSNINSVKEITFWEKTGDYSKYPLYNPWSTVLPYRVDQNLFMEDASFLKLRSLSIGYDLTKAARSRMKLQNLYIYTTLNNVFTLSKYSGRDPELVDYTGYDTGYGLPIPRTFTLGVKMEL